MNLTNGQIKPWEKNKNEKCDFYSLENLFCFSASIFKINRWHGIKDKINKNEKYTSVTKMVTKCQYNLLVNIKIHSHTYKDLPPPPPKCPKNKSKCSKWEIKYSVFGDSSSIIPAKAFQLYMLVLNLSVCTQQHWYRFVFMPIQKGKIPQQTKSKVLVPTNGL